MATIVQPLTLSMVYPNIQNNPLLHITSINPHQCLSLVSITWDGVPSTYSFVSQA